MPITTAGEVDLAGLIARRSPLLCRGVEGAEACRPAPKLLADDGGSSEVTVPPYDRRCWLAMCGDAVATASPPLWRDVALLDVRGSVA